MQPQEKKKQKFISQDEKYRKNAPDFKSAIIKLKACQRKGNVQEKDALKYTDENDKK